MAEHRVIIVEGDAEHGEHMASLLSSGGVEAQVVPAIAPALEALGAQPAGLLVARAELGDESGFSLIDHIKEQEAFAGLPTLLVSSAADPSQLKAHRQGPTAADGYLQVPFAPRTFTALVTQLLGVPPEVSESDVDGAFEAATGGGGFEREGPSAIPDVPAAVLAAAGNVPPPIPEKGAPPRLPRRDRKTVVTADDEAFVQQIFGSLDERRTELLAEARRRALEGRGRAAPRPTGPVGPDEKIQLLRHQLREREIDLARLSEIWTAADRGRQAIEEKVSERDQEIMTLKGQLQEMVQRVNQAKEIFEKREGEHAELVESLLTQKVMEEKDLIEVVAAKEKQINELYREIRVKGDENAGLVVAVEQVQGQLAEVEKGRQRELLASEMRESRLKGKMDALEAAVAHHQGEAQRIWRQSQEAAGALRRVAATEAALGREAQDARGVAERAAAYLARTLELGPGAGGGALEAEAERVALAEARAENAGLRALLLEAEIGAQESQQTLVQLWRQREGVRQALGDRLEQASGALAALEERATEQADAASHALEGQRAALAEAEASRAREAAEAAQRLEEIQARAHAAEVEAQRLGESLASLEVEHQALDERQAQTEAGLSAQLSEAMSRAGELEGELQVLQGAQVELEAALEEARGEAGDQGEAAARLRADLGEAQSRAAALEAELQLSQGGRAEVEATLEEIRAEASDRGEQVRRLTEEISAARREAAAATQEGASTAEALRAELEAAQGGVAALGAELEASQAALAQAREQGAAALQAAQAEQAAAAQAGQSAQAALQAKLGELEAARAATAASLEALQAEHATAAQDLEAHRAALQEARVSGRKREEVQAERLAQATGQVSALEQKIAGLEHARAEAAQGSASQIEALEAAVAKADGKRKETVEKANAFIEQAKGQIASYKKKLQQAEASLSQVQSTMGEAEQRLTQRAEAAEAARDEAAAKLKAAIEEASQLKAKVDSLGKRAKEELRAELERREARRVAEVQRLQQSVQEKSRALKVAELELQRLKARISGAKAKKASAAPAARAPAPAPKAAPAPAEKSEDEALDELLDSLG